MLCIIPVSPKLVLLLFLVAFVCNSYGQGNYHPGVVVNLAGDSLHGFIDYKRWDRSPLKISFKQSETSAAVEYNPSNIRSFSVANEIYESAIVNVDTSPFQINDLDDSPLPIYVKDTIFLQTLVRGEKSLLHYKDTNAKNHFYIVHESEYEPLTFKQYTVETERSSNVIRKNEGYKQTLALYLNACPEIQKSLKFLNYNVKSLTKLFSHFYTCTNQSTKYIMERKDEKIELGIVAGASATMLKFKGDFNFNYLVNNDYETSVNPTIGFFCDLKILRSNGWYITNDFFYTSFNIEGEGSGTELLDTYTTHNSFKYQYFKTHHMLQVNLLPKRSFYFSAGFSMGFVIESETLVLMEFEDSGTRERFFKSRNSEFGFVAGLGFRVGKWNGEARYEQSSGISNFTGLQSTLSRVHLLVKYRIFK